MEKEIKHTSGSAGGFLVGRSHANNGIKAINKSTGLPLEMEGGEVVITKTAVEDDELREFEGEMLTNRQILSKINESGGGVSFALGGDIPTELYFTGNSYKYGGDTLTDYEIAHKISSCGCKHQNDGLSQGKTIEDIAAMHNVSVSHIENQIKKGVQVEAEHTSNPQEQVKIAMDHLVENPNYYDILAEAHLEKGGKISPKTTAIKTTSYKHYQELISKGLKAELVTKQDLKTYAHGGNLKKGAETDDLDNVVEVSDEVLDAPDIIASEGGYFEKGGEVYSHKHSDSWGENITIKLLEPTSKGWKVEQTTKKGKKETTKTAFFTSSELKEMFVKNEVNFSEGGEIKKENEELLRNKEIFGYESVEVRLIEQALPHFPGLKVKEILDLSQKIADYDLVVRNHTTTAEAIQYLTQDFSNYDRNNEFNKKSIKRLEDLGIIKKQSNFLPTDIPQKLRSDIAFLVDLQDKKRNNRPSDGWDINLFKSSFFNKVKKLPNDQAIVVLDFLTALEETVGVKPIFSKNHKIWENYSTQKEVSNNSEFQVGDKIKYKNSSEVGEVIEVVPSQFEDIISIKYPNGEIVKDGVTNLEKPKNTESEFEEIGGNFSFKNKFGSFTSVKVMPVDASLKPSKEFFSLAITVRKTTSDGKNIIQNKPLITMPVSQYKEYMTDLKTKVNQGSENFKKDLEESAKLIPENIKSIRKYKDSTIQDRYNFQDKKQEFGYIVEFESGKQWIGYAEDRNDAKTKALYEFDDSKTNIQSKYQVGDFVKYETGDLESERWVGEIKEVKNYGNEIAYKIDAYTRGVEAAPMFDAANNNEVYEAQLKPTNDLVFNEAKKHYNRVMEKKQAEQNKKYDLGASFAGGVTVVWDRNQTKNGDYKTIAHIPSIGNVKYFEENLPQYVIDYVEGMKNNNISREPQTQTNYQISNYRNPYEVNRAIEQLIDSKESGFTPNEIEFISNYSGYGGLEKQGSFSDEELKGLLYEYFTPDAIVKKMWALAYKYGFGTIENPHVMEPSVGTGNFFKYAPINAELFGNEINRFSKKVCEILYPKAMITLQPFEKNFISKNNSIKNKLSDIHKYHLVIGNPPYGRADSKFLAMGEKDYTKASNFTEYFITRGLDLLHPGGLLIFVVGAEQYNGGTLFLDSGISTVKKNIFDKAQLVDAYRLPTKIFERTGVASEILVFKKK